ncbi:MAG TPA: hypothetical protein VNT99_19090 [Methylomirabilota bacterium]|nr:hypothetical protein [Methylomirabilota bacterium]
MVQAPAHSFPRATALPRWLATSTVAAFLAVAITYAFYFVFSRMMSLDEGYLMITVQGFLEGHALYDSLFTQYGPFYYLYEWFMRAVLSVPLTHDATRWLCIFHWITASALFGMAGGRMTKSFACGVFVFALSVVHLRELANEPGHPQELVMLLVAIGALAAMREGTKTGAWELLAGIAAALTFTKINVGVFFGFALLLAVRCHASGRWTRVSNWVLLALCLGVPFALMRRHLAMDWCRNYALVAACALVAVFFVASSVSPRTEFAINRYFKMAAFFIIPSILFAGVAVLTGTSIRGLLEGLLVTPLKMSETVLMPLPFPDIFAFNAIVAVVVAWLVIWKRGGPLVLILKLCYGLAGSFLLIGQYSAQLGALLPWVWLVLIPTGQPETQTRTQSFARVFLCLAAACQALQAYPVAGTQIANATFLLVMTYALCLTDGLRAVRVSERIKTQFKELKPGTVQLSGLLGTVALLYIFANVWCQLPATRRLYASLAPLNLPGSQQVRVQPEAAALFQEMASYLETESDAFITYPCFNSFYFWTGQRPPTQLNGTGWLQFNHAQQEQILAALQQARRPRIVLPTALARRWETEGAPFVAPLVQCMFQQCQEVKRIGPYSVFAPKPPGKVLSGL